MYFSRIHEDIDLTANQMLKKKKDLLWIFLWKKLGILFVSRLFCWKIEMYLIDIYTYVKNDDSIIYSWDKREQNPNIVKTFAEITN